LTKEKVWRFDQDSSQTDMVNLTTQTISWIAFFFEPLFFAWTPPSGITDAIDAPRDPISHQPAWDQEKTHAIDRLGTAL
jgi:hypothetical protein